MDPYQEYNKQLEYYKYIEEQRENYIDLSSNLPDPNDSIVQFADILFDKSKNILDRNLTGILVDGTMETADIFCMLVELLLYGLYKLSAGSVTIFDILETTDEMVENIRAYFKSAGFEINLREDFVDDNVVIYRDRNDYYCEILSKPPAYLCFKGWYVLNYRLLVNNNFKFSLLTPLDKFKSFFISKENKIFTFSFQFRK